MTDGFKDHPESITERRSDKSQNAADWTPRDALIHLLRRIDSGEKIDAMVICFAQINGSAITPHFLAATPNPLISSGLLARCEYMIQL